MIRTIKIWDGKLEIEQTGLGYMVCNKELSFFAHPDKLELQSPYNSKQTWLKMFAATGIYIGSIWINANTDMKKIKKFLEETKYEKSK